MMGDAEGARAPLPDPAGGPTLVAVVLISSPAVQGTNAVPVAVSVIGESFARTESAIGLVASDFTLAVLVAIPS